MLYSNSALDSQKVLTIEALTDEQKDAMAARVPSYVRAPEGYTDAYSRVLFHRNSYHCPGRNISIQMSNLPHPDESTDNDWVDVTASMTGYVCTDLLARWIRVKGVQAGDRVYVRSQLQYS